MDDETVEMLANIFGGSDSDEELFTGFRLEEIVKEEESDVDLDILVADGGDLGENLDINYADYDSVSCSSVSSVELSSESDSDLALPAVAGPSKRKRKQKKRKKQAQRKNVNVEMNWSKETSEVNIDHPFVEKVGVVHDLEVGASPFDFLSPILPESFYSDVAEQTNLNAEQKIAASGKVDKLWKQVSAEEIKIYLYINYMFGIHHMPEASMYWSSDPLLRVPAVADAMSKSRFEKISQYFHLNNNANAVPKGHAGYDPLFKVRPLLDLVLKKSKQHYKPGREVSIDEAMIKYTGRLSFKQYIKGKPHPWGIKVWVAADPRTGYILDFDVYLGKIAEPMPFGVGHHVVMKVGSDFLDKGHHLYFDNFFSSVSLAKALEDRKTCSCATVRMNRKGWPSELDRKLVKKMKTGDVEFYQDGNCVATLWKDKRPVAVLSTNCDAKMDVTSRRTPGGRRDFHVPCPVLTYNQHMGGVDLADQIHSYYPVGRPGVRWWRYLAWWLLQVAMVNAFIIWRASNRPVPSKRGLRHLDFRLDCLRALSKVAVKSKRVQTLPAVSASDPFSHTAFRYPGRKANCILCQTEKMKTTNKGKCPQTVYGCPVCKIHLCKGLCFTQYHLKLAQQSE